MADLVIGAVGSLIPKLYQLLEEEYNLMTSVKKRITSLTQELELAQAALRQVAEVPWDQLDEQVQIWARQVREASYDMEDVLDIFLVRVRCPDSAAQEVGLLKHLKKMLNWFERRKARRKVSGDVNDIISHLKEVTERCRRYKVHDIVARRATALTVDPRLAAMYTKANKLVGLDQSSGELMSKLQLHDASNAKMKIVSIFGIGGLGKSSLAKAVFDNLRGDFDCRAFVSVGRNPDLPEVLHRILIDLDKKRIDHFNFAGHGITRLIDEFKIFHRSEKRCFIVIDDLWDRNSWETIKLAIGDDNNSGSRILITTRILEVAEKADEVYRLPPLPHDICRHLLYTRIYGDERKYIIDNKPDKISDEILRKCGGIPPAIITMASLLAGKPKDKWSKIYKSIGFGCKDNEEAKKTMGILNISYYDLPAHLRACLLYLSAFPEDYVIHKGSLVWKWVAEGFVHKEDGISLFETGEGYFNDLINRSMQAVVSDYDESIIIGCRVHDMVLDFIRKMSREEIFFTVLDSNQDTLLQSNVRRLASHNKTMGHPPHANHIEMPKLRSLIALGCVIETSVTLSSFTLLRVLAIENFNSMDGSCVRVEDLGHLLHLRFLSLSGTQVDRIPKEIGALRFLQTLDLLESRISELPSASSMPKQLVCLRIALYRDALDGKVFSVEGLTSLEELSIKGLEHETTRWLVKDLSCLSELRVLETDMFWDEETKRGLVESVRHLDKLQTLIIHRAYFNIRAPTWQATELVLPSHLQHLAVNDIRFCKLPSCINPSCLPNLSHLDLRLQHVDEHDLKTLGTLPELRFLGLDLWWSSSATISNINDSDVCYFPKLRCCRLPWSMVLFVANKEDKTVSFHMWNGLDRITMPSLPDDKLKREDELQSPMPRASDDDELLQRPLQCSKLRQGFAALVYYLIAFFLHVLAFVKRWSLENVGQHRCISDRGSASCNRNLNRNRNRSRNGNGEDPAAMPFVSDDEKKGSFCSKQHAVAKAQCFMPSLQVLHFEVRGRAMEDHRWCDNLGLEYLSSLREFNVGIGCFRSHDTKEKVEEALRRASQFHPNRPALRIRQRLTQ